VCKHHTPAPEWNLGVHDRPGAGGSTCPTAATSTTSLYEMVRGVAIFNRLVDAGWTGLQIRDSGPAARKVLYRLRRQHRCRKIAIPGATEPPVSQGGGRFATATITYPQHTHRLLRTSSPRTTARQRVVDITRPYALGHPTFPPRAPPIKWVSESQLEAYPAGWPAHTSSTSAAAQASAGQTPSLPTAILSARSPSNRSRIIGVVPMPAYSGTADPDDRDAPRACKPRCARSARKCRRIRYRGHSPGTDGHSPPPARRAVPYLRTRTR